MSLTGLPDMAVKVCARVTAVGSRRLAKAIDTPIEIRIATILLGLICIEGGHYREIYSTFSRSERGSKSEPDRESDRPELQAVSVSSRPLHLTAATASRGTKFMEYGRYSGLMFANLTTFAHFSVSSAMSLPNSAGEPVSTLAPRS